MDGAAAPIGSVHDSADDALARRLAFIVEVDRLKGVLRRTRLLDGSRHENSAEHSWHLALMAVVLADAAGAPVDLVRVLTLLLVHDLVEIDAGDTFAFDAAGNLGKVDRERLAAQRVFGLLPEDEGARLRDAWEEFEAGGLRLGLLAADGGERCDVALRLTERPGGLSGLWDYNAEMFEPGTIGRMARDYEKLLAGAVAEPERPLNQLWGANEEEAMRVIAGFNDDLESL